VREFRHLDYEITKLDSSFHFVVELHLNIIYRRKRRMTNTVVVGRAKNRHRFDICLSMKGKPVQI
jgi:hypothetical protein